MDSSKPDRRMLRAVTAAIVLVNTIGIYGQVAWFWHDQHLPFIGAVGAAIALESIALALAAMSHHAMLAGDSAWSLAGGARGMSVIAGLLNLSHYSPHGITRPDALGVIFGLLSASSAFLWGALAKRQARDKFLAEGVIERRTVKVGSMMWLLYPREAYARLRAGVFHGENRLAEVRRIVADDRAPAVARESREQRGLRALSGATTKADAIRAAGIALGDAPNAQIAAWVSQHWTASVTPESVRKQRSKDARKADNGANVVKSVDFRQGIGN